MANNFVPLRIISGYSFLQSGLTIEKIVDSINKHDFYGGGLSDYGVLYGVPSFIKALEKNKRKYMNSFNYLKENQNSLLKNQKPQSQRCVKDMVLISI